MFIGFGDLAKRALASLLEIADVIGVSRRPEHLPSALSHGVYGDYGSLDGLAKAAEIKPDYLLTPVPASRDIAGYQQGYASAAENIAGAGLLSNARRAIFVSSTRVYAERSGGWVNEDSALAAGDLICRCAALGEACFRRHATTTVVRPSGLYDGANPIMLRPILEGLSRVSAAALPTEFIETMLRVSLLS